MGDQYINAANGDAIRVAEHLLSHGANVDGELKEYTPLPTP